MPYTVTLHDENGKPVESRTFERPCQALQFMEARQAALPVERRGVTDNTAEGLEAIRRYCAEHGQPSSPPPLDAVTPAIPSATGQDGGGVGGTATPPPEEETPASLGALNPEAPVHIESPDRGPGTDDGRSQNEQVFDPRAPKPDYEVADHLAGQGMSDEETAEELERIRRNLAPPGQPHPMFSLDDAPDLFSAEDPVVMFSGQFSTQVTDVMLPSPGMPLHFTRSYRSYPPSYGPLGYNWDHAYNIRLRPLTSGGAAIWTGRHSEDEYRPGPDGQFQSPTGIFARLVRDPATATTPERYRLQHADRTEWLFERPPGWPRPGEIPLRVIGHPSGNEHSLEYDAEGRLVRVTDGDGRALILSYAEDRIASVNDHTGRTWTYAYDDNLEVLVAVTTPAVPTVSPAALEDTTVPAGQSGNRELTTCYEYQGPDSHPALVHNLVGILDPARRVVVENVYGSDPGSHDFGRVIRQVYGGHAASFHATRLQYVPRGPETINVPALRVETCGESGYRVHTFNYRGNLLEERYRLVRDGSYRIVARSYAYDRQGNRIKECEPNGMAVCKTYDVANPDPRAHGNLLRLELSPPPTAPLAGREVLTLTYESRYGQIKTVRTEAGSTTTYVYDYEVSPNSLTSRGDLVRIDHPDATLPDGAVQHASEHFEWDDRGRIARHTSAAGHVCLYQYYTAGPARGFLHRTVAGLGREDQAQSFEYDPFGNLTQVLRVRNGAAVGCQREFDALGRLIRERQPADAEGKRGEVSYHYGPDGHLAAVDRPGGALGPSGGFIRDLFEHDALGRLRRLVCAANTETSQAWRIERNSEGLPLRIVGPLGDERRFEYDERQMLLRQVQRFPGQAASTSTFIYDRLGNLQAAIDPTGVQMGYRYDPWGRLEVVELPGEEGKRTSVRHGYDPGGRLARVEAVGLPGAVGAPTILRLTEFGYDARGRLVEHKEGGSHVHSIYDADSQLVALQHHRGATLQIEVDALGRVREVTDALSNRMVRDYDAAGDLVEISEHEQPPGGSAGSSGGSSEQVFRNRTDFDDRGRPVRLRDSLGNETLLEYDDRDLLTAVVDPLGRRSEYIYDALGNLISAKSFLQPGGPALEHRWARDGLGRVVVYSTPEGHETRYTWADESSWNTLQLADGATWQRVFDAAGRVLRETSPSGITRVQEYNAAGLMQRYRVEDAAGAALLEPVVFEYDGLGRMTAAAQGSSRVEWDFDAAGRVVREASDGEALLWKYDDAGGHVDMSWPDGRIDRHVFDQLGRLQAIRLLQPSAAPPAGAAELTAGTELAGYAYIGPERLHKRCLGNGTSTLYAYDEARRLVRLSHRGTGDVLLAETEYVHDAAGRRRLVRTAPTPGQAVLYDFDALGRLISAHEGVGFPPAPAGLTGQGGPLSQSGQNARIAAVDPGAASRVHLFGLDPDDGRHERRVLESAATLVDTYTLAPTKALRRIDRNLGGTLQSSDVDHDADGRRLRDDRYAYAFDPLGRLASVHDIHSGQELLTQEFDPIGRPRRRVLGGKILRLLHRGARLVQETQELDGAGTVARQYTFGTDLDELVLQNGDGQRWGHQDARGTLLAVSDGQGAVLERYGYEPFGRTRAFSPAGDALDAPAAGVDPRFGGHAVLAPGVMDLFEARARVYDAGTGHFLQRDRRGAVDSPNAWLYAAHNPVDLVDPSGEVLPIIAAMVILGAVGGAGYSTYDATEHPERYRGSFSFRTLFQVAGGAAVGGLSGLMGEAVIGAMGLGSAPSVGGGLAASGQTLTMAQTFVAGGTVSALSGMVWRTGFQGLFPEYVDPPGAGTLATDYVLGGAIGLVFRAVEAVGNPFTREGRNLLQMNLQEGWQRVRMWHLRGAGEIEKAEQVGRGIAEIRVGRTHAAELVSVGQPMESLAYRVPGEGQYVVFNPEIDVVTDSAWIQIKSSQNAARQASVGMNQAEYTAYGVPAGKHPIYYIEPAGGGRISRPTLQNLGRLGITDVRPLTPDLRGTAPFPLPFGGASGLPFAQLPFFLLNPNDKREPGQWGPAVASRP